MERKVGSIPDKIMHYPSPTDVLRDPRLSDSEKRGVLQRWALTAYRSELAFPKTDAAAYPSCLNDLIDALLDLEEPRIQNLLSEMPRRFPAGR